MHMHAHTCIRTHVCTYMYMHACTHAHQLPSQHPCAPSQGLSEEEGERKGNERGGQRRPREPSPLQRSQQAPLCLTARAQSLDSTGHFSLLQVTSLFWAKETRDTGRQLQAEAPNPSPRGVLPAPLPSSPTSWQESSVTAAGCAVCSRSPPPPPPPPGTHGLF